MRYHSLRRSINGSLLGLALLSGSAWGLAAQYTLTVLGPDEVRGTPTRATAITPEGDTIVGDLSSAADYNVAVQFTPISQALSGAVSGAFDVEEGIIVGFVYDASDQQPGHYPPTAAVWDHGTRRLLPRPNLPVLAPHNHSLATCANAAGDIWGTGVRGDYWHPPQHPGTDLRTIVLPLEWVDGTLLLELPTLGGAQGSVNACDDGGNSAGWSTTAHGDQHCTQWFANGHVADCHPHHGTSDSTAVAMNNRGQLVANATQYGRSFGYLWQWHYLAWLMPLPGDHTSTVQALNENGEAVGQSCTSITCRAVGWERQRPVELLPRVTNAAGWALYEAVAISDEGGIVAHGVLDRQDHVVLLTPIDTPTEAWFAWKARIYNWYVRQYVMNHRPHAHD